MEDALTGVEDPLLLVLGDDDVALGDHHPLDMVVGFDRIEPESESSDDLVGSVSAAEGFTQPLVDIVGGGGEEAGHGFPVMGVQRLPISSGDGLVAFLHVSHDPSVDRAGRMAQPTAVVAQLTGRGSRVRGSSPGCRR